MSVFPLDFRPITVSDDAWVISCTFPMRIRDSNRRMREIWRACGRGRKPKGLRKHIRREKAARRTA